MKERETISIGDIFKRLRITRMLSQEELAYLCNIDRRYIYDLEKGIHRPGFDVFVKLAWAFGMEPDALMKEIQRHVNLHDVIKN